LRLNVWSAGPYGSRSCSNRRPTSSPTIDSGSTPPAVPAIAGISALRIYPPPRALRENVIVPHFRRFGKSTTSTARRVSSLRHGHGRRPTTRRRLGLDRHEPYRFRFIHGVYRRLDSFIGARDDPGHRWISDTYASLVASYPTLATDEARQRTLETVILYGVLKWVIIAGPLALVALLVRR